MRAVVIDTRRAVYCGPMAICAVTGRSASEVIERIERHRGPSAWCAGGRRRRAIIGMRPEEVARVVRSFGFHCAYHPVGLVAPDMRLTLAGLIRIGAITRPTIVHVTEHYLAIDGRTVIDTATGGRPVPHVKAPGWTESFRGFFDIRSRVRA